MRDELEREFEAYKERGRLAGETGDWASWADQFTEDATYVEHHYGRFAVGRFSNILAAGDAHRGLNARNGGPIRHKLLMT